MSLFQELGQITGHMIKRADESPLPRIDAGSENPAVVPTVPAHGKAKYPVDTSKLPPGYEDPKVGRGHSQRYSSNYKAPLLIGYPRQQTNPGHRLSNLVDGGITANGRLGQPRRTYEGKLQYQWKPWQSDKERRLEFWKAINEDPTISAAQLRSTREHAGEVRGLEAMGLDKPDHREPAKYQRPSSPKKTLLRGGSGRIED